MSVTIYLLCPRWGCLTNILKYLHVTNPMPAAYNIPKHHFSGCYFSNNLAYSGLLHWVGYSFVFVCRCQHFWRCLVWCGWQLTWQLVRHDFRVWQAALRTYFRQPDMRCQTHYASWKCDQFKCLYFSIETWRSKLWILLDMISIKIVRKMEIRFIIYFIIDLHLFY